MSKSRGSLYWKCLVILILVIPFFYNYAVFNPFEFPKFIAFVVGVFLIGIYFFYHTLRANGVSREVNIQNVSSRQARTIDRFILAYVLVVFLSDILGVDPRISLLGSMYRHQGFITLLCGVLTYLLIRIIPKETLPKAFSFFSKGVFLTTVGICVAALYHIFASGVLQDNTIPLYNGRIVGTFGNPDFLSGYLVMMLPFILLSKNFLQKYISFPLFFVVQIIVLCGVFVVILFTQSRGNLLFASIIVFLSLCIVISRLRFFLKIMFGIVLSIFTIGMIFYYPIMLSSNNRVSEWESRTLFYTTGIKALVKRPLLGYGQENFELLFPINQHIKVDSAHNIFLEVAVGSGIVGLLLFCSIIISAFLKASIQIKLSLLGFLLAASINPVSIAHISLLWLLVGFSKNY